MRHQKIPFLPGERAGARVRLKIPPGRHAGAAPTEG